MAGSIFRFSSLDAVLLGLAVLQAALCGICLFVPQGALWWKLLGALAFGVIVWWNANTISHNHLHSPLFRLRALNRAFSLFLTLTTGVPQTLWRAQHLFHHAGEPKGRKLRLGAFGFVELGLLAGLWLGLFAFARSRFLFGYLPGYAFAMLLCQLQGYFEHAGQPVALEPGISYYGRLYNLLWFNDGYHAEHHRHPGTHWSRLPLRKLPLPGEPAPTVSSLPPLLRFLPLFKQLPNRVQARALVALEQLALREGRIQRFMLESHLRAFAILLREPALATLLATQKTPRIGVVGGGLFPRTALVLAQLLPQAQLVILDENAAHIGLAETALLRAGIAAHRFTLLTERYCAERHRDFDLLIFPLGYLGDRDALYRVRRGEPPRLIHDWILPLRGHASVCISPFLLKRLNLVLPVAAQPSAATRLGAAA